MTNGVSPFDRYDPFLEEGQAPTQSDALVRITALAKLLQEAAAKVDEATETLTLAKARHAQLERETLPDLMRELGLSEITLLDGSKVSVGEDVDCNISEERRARAHAWLSEHGFGGLIKTEVGISFGRDERDEALAFIEQARELTTSPVQLKEAVHPQTLKAFIKERRAAASDEPENNPPEDLFGIRSYSKAKLTTKKGR